MRNPTVFRFLGLAAALWVAAAAAPAAAQIQGVRPEGHFDLTRGINVGLGARVDIPLVPQGFIDTVNDEFALSPGVDLLVGKNDPWVVFPVALQWNFYLQRDWSLFPELGLALLIGDHKGKGDVDLDIVLAAGGRYHMGAQNTLVLRLGWPILLQFGMTF